MRRCQRTLFFVICERSGRSLRMDRPWSWGRFSDHATFSKDFVLCHLWTKRKVTTNGQALELGSFLRRRTSELVKIKNLSQKLEEIGDSQIKMFPIFFSFLLLISHDRVAFDLVKNRSQGEAENKATARQQCAISPLARTNEAEFD